MQANTNDVLGFLTREYTGGFSYKALQNLISALNNRITYSVRHHRTTEKFIKGVLIFVHHKTNTIQFRMLINYYNICNPRRLKGIWT